MSCPAPESRGLILVVDDDESLRLLARAALEQAGFAVDEAASGEEALRIFGEADPDIVLLDVKMPGMDGFTCCSRLRQTPAGRHVPILMLTGLDDLGSIRRAYEAGATDFVIKPINWVILSHRVGYMLRASRSADQLRTSQAKLAHAQHIAQLGYWEWDLESDSIACSDELYRILGRSRDETIDGVPELLEWVHPEDRNAVQEFFQAARENAAGALLEFRLLRPDGEERSVQQQAETLPGTNGGPARVTGTIQDVTDRRRAERKIRYLAYYDGLTGLPNRRAFIERLELALAQARRADRKLAVLFLDLDRFKRINDTLGHNAGDHLLRQVSDRLVRCIRSTDLVGRPPAGELDGLISRFGGDEYVLLLSEIAEGQDAAKVARRLTEALVPSFDLEGQEVFVTTSIGISLYPYDGNDAESLIKNADTAMYHAKDQGGNNYQYYNESMNASALERLFLETSLSTALDQDQLRLYYQPQYDLASGAIVGAEALLRWRHPELGLVQPARFIGLAEETGLIFNIGDWVVRSACRQMRRWLDAGLPPVRIAVNLSSREFTQDGFPDRIRDHLGENGVEAGLLDLELTESILLEDGEQSVQRMRELKAQGLRLSIDDFGTGYSSLSYLRRLPVDSLKIDRSFLRGTPHDPDDTAITRAIIAMARSLRLNVVAEGVEIREQIEFLRRERCNEAQGFLMSRPLAAEDLAYLLERPAGLRIRTAAPLGAPAL